MHDCAPKYVAHPLYDPYLSSPQTLQPYVSYVQCVVPYAVVLAARTSHCITFYALHCHPMNPKLCPLCSAGSRQATVHSPGSGKHTMAQS